MHPDLEKLIPLQALDREAQQLREQIAATPRRLAEMDARYQASLQKTRELATGISTEQAAARRIESDIVDLRAKLDRARKKIDSATTTAQVTALEHETAFAQAEISRLEDLELESMERSEALEARLPAAETSVRELAAEIATARERAEQSLSRDRAALAEVDRRRNELRAEVLASPTGESSLSRYDRIAAHRGTAISQALLGKCEACGMMVRPQLWQDLRDNSPDSPSRETLSTCENCGRLLYYDPARDAPQRKPVQNESIAASIVRSSI